MAENTKEAEMKVENDYNLVYHTFKNIGCCQMCCLRFIGEKSYSSFTEVEKTLKAKSIEDGVPTSPKAKIQKPSPCIACLGLLQKPYCDTLIENVLKDLLKEEYDCDSYNIALTLPVSFQLRAHSMFLHVDSKFPTFSNFHFPLGVVTVGVKDVWKWVYTPLISSALKKKYNPSSDLIITLSLKYQDEEKECVSLFAMFPDKFSKTKNRKNQGSYDNFSRKSAETYLRVINSERFSTFYPVPPNTPNSEIVYSETSTHHNSVFIAGRYNKLSRNLPQTPWILNGERKLEGSVEELIAASMKYMLKAKDSRFSSSGREDVDVRTLGRGRPFYLELIDPRKVKIGFDGMRELEKDINEKAGGQIFVRDLQFVNKSELDNLKTGEESKTKEYRALCVLLDHDKREKCNSNLKELSQKFPLTLQQSTPVRVLHRRPVAVRERTVHWLNTSLLDENKDHFTISLNTQAGTYIKEFVHGDFGRTRPCLGELLGDLQVDILALDVQGVLLDWPPSVEYKT